MPEPAAARTSSARIIVSGLIGQYPLGGVTWDYIQYILGLRQLGHDVYYLEDTGQWPYDPAEGGISNDSEHTVRYLSDVMARFDLADRWMYRFPWGPRWFGLPERRRAAIIGSADLVINVSGTLRAPHEYRGRGRLAYIDTDPVFTQIKLARGQADFRQAVEAHDIHFSFGELLQSGRAHGVPDVGIDWIPTRQPIVLDEWRRPPETVRDTWTTVLNWTSYKPVVHEGRTYGQKDVEMLRFMELPTIVEQPLELAISPGKTTRTPHALLRRRGWQVVDPNTVCPDTDTYRDYIATSGGEWSVAKNGYVAGWSGWFSCRTACYLAAGRPAVVQDTGFSEVLPTGLGLLAFGDLEQARAALDAVRSDRENHSRAARDLAVAIFDSATVLADLVATATRDAGSPAVRGRAVVTT